MTELTGDAAREPGCVSNQLVRLDSHSHPQIARRFESISVSSQTVVATNRLQ